MLSATICRLLHDRWGVYWRVTGPTIAFGLAALRFWRSEMDPFTERSAAPKHPLPPTASAL
ncbi:hypothetical protein CC78DRAFT_537275 [Lojkania enalia]|uniref:Uncharacterized protein n=1 Tax=Lojkania enalia TaxID=147567 RepID=A0A9P4K2Y9_9PLEO|nr:hypothetical protein CC78DRAFT_537275 [Didymosphaeria enalia]